MRLYVTVVAAPGIAPPAIKPSSTQGPLSNHHPEPVDLILDLEPIPGRVLADRLNQEIFASARFWVDGQDLFDLQAGTPPLVSGAVIVMTAPAGPPPRRQRPTGHELTFSALSGPDTGTMQMLKRGRYSIGRTAEDLHIADPQLSRLHAELILDPTSVRIEDKGSANGTYVNQRQIGSQAISTESEIAMGLSTCGLRFSSEFDYLFESSGDPSEPLIVHKEPSTQRRGTMLLMALLPVALGVGLALMTGMWMFLAFSAMSAFTMLIPVLGGRKRRRKFKKELESANRADSARRTSATPSVAEIIRFTIHQAQRIQDSKDHPVKTKPATRKRGASDGWVRLGLADQYANVRPDPADSDYVPSLLHAMPVTLNLNETRDISITGSAQHHVTMVHSLVVQISSWTSDADRRLIFFGPITKVPLAVRFLPQADVVQAPGNLIDALETVTDRPAVLFLADTSLLTEDIELLLQHHTATGRLTIIRYGEHAPPLDSPTVNLLRDRAVLKVGDSVLDFVPDLVAARNFERYCRSKAKLDSARSPEAATRKPVTLPKVVALDTLVHTAANRIQDSWTKRDSGNGPAGPIGVRSSGNVLIDLQRDGPHLLVAGTTGSGKSELLRTLILSLCLNHSPLSVNFLLVDFKGGSGLGPLRKLPHSVGLLTDLSAESIGRAMQSLRAEVRRREALFAEVEAGDLSRYRKLRGPGMEDVPRLVIVIDEFRMLLEKVPTALDELLQIASLGRSLGLHLVLATQRPQGAISADIRANITTSISLRVQTAMESQDILDTSAAAAISISAPGRAFLKRSGEPVEEFQSASSSLMQAHSEPVRISLLQDSNQEKSDPTNNPDMKGGEAALASYLQASIEAWAAEGSPALRQPVLPELPDNLDAVPASSCEPLDSSAICAHHCTVSLGLLDLPSRQKQVELRWSPRNDSHLALIGGPRSGVTEAIRNITAQLLQSELQNVHLYVLDGDGSLPGLAHRPQVGAYVTGDEVGRATRVIRRLASALSERLIAAATPDHAPASERDMDGSTSPDQSTLVLVMTGWGRWLSAIRSSPWPWAEETIQDVIRDGGRARIVVVVGGDRELVSARIFGAIENRLFLPTGASAESLMAWPRLPAMKQEAGRAYVEGKIAPLPGICQLITRRDINWEESARGKSDVDAPGPPFRVEALPSLLRAPELPEAKTGADEVVVGVQGDDLHPAIVRIPAGSLYLVLGPARSGKTSTLDLLARQGPPSRRWIRLSPESLEDEFDELVHSLNRRTPEITFAPGPATILVDDADRLSPQAQQNLAQIHSEGFGVIMTAATSPSVMSRIPLASAARIAARGMVLMPRSAFDGEFFGVRLETDSAPPPGRAAIIEDGTAKETQLLHLAKGHDGR